MVARGGRARNAGPIGPRPTGKLILYEFEGCPWCRRVREAITDLDLTVEVRPCPKRGERYRPEGIARSGRRQFPFLIDEGAGVELLESSDIARHLYDRYGTGTTPFWLAGPQFGLMSQVATMARMGAGTFARSSRLPESTLHLIGHESDPMARIARERLCELELPYIRSNGPLQLVDGEERFTELADVLARIEAYAA